MSFHASYHNDGERQLLISALTVGVSMYIQDDTDSSVSDKIDDDDDDEMATMEHSITDPDFHSSQFNEVVSSKTSAPYSGLKTRRITLDNSKIQSSGFKANHDKNQPMLTVPNSPVAERNETQLYPRLDRRQSLGLSRSDPSFDIYAQVEKQRLKMIQRESPEMIQAQIVKKKAKNVKRNLIKLEKLTHKLNEMVEIADTVEEESFNECALKVN